jgi:hypothetical protein
MSGPDASSSALISQFIQSWPSYTGAAQPSGPVGIYKVKTVEASTLWSPLDSNVNVQFEAGRIDFGLGTNLSELQLAAPSTSSVRLNATSLPGTDSTFILQSGDDAKTLSLTTSAQRTQVVSTASAFDFMGSASGSAQFQLGTESVTLSAGTTANQLLRMFGSNVEIRGAVLNANARLDVKDSTAIMKLSNTELAFAPKLDPSDVTIVTIGGIVGGNADTTVPAKFLTNAAGSPKTWLNAGAAYFSGDRVGLNWRVGAPAAEPAAELDVNGTVIARVAVQSSNVWAMPSSNTMSIGWDMSLLGSSNLRKIILQADTIEMVGDINQMNKTDLRIQDTSIFLGHIPNENTLDGVTDAANAAGPGAYSDTFYDGSGVILWNLPDGYQTFFGAASVADKPEFADYSQSIRWYKRGGMFSTVTPGTFVSPWNRSSWELSGGNFTMRGVTGHASYMFAIDTADDSLKLYKVDKTSVKEVANFNSSPVA